MFVHLKMLTKASCPYCLSTQVRPSHRRFYEKPMSFFRPSPVPLFALLRSVLETYATSAPPKTAANGRPGLLLARGRHAGHPHISLHDTRSRQHMRLLRFHWIMAKAKKCGARLLYLVVNLFVFTVCLITITSMLFVAVWMRVQQARGLDNTADGMGDLRWRSQRAMEDSHGKASSSNAVAESTRGG